MSNNDRRFLKDLLCIESEKPVLEQLYLQHRVPTDQLRRCPDVLRSIVDAFNAICGRSEDESLLLRYMINRRKKQDWPTLGCSARKFSSPLVSFTTSELLILKRIYLDRDNTSDELLFEKSELQLLSRCFREATGRAVRGSILVAVIQAKRKRGEWVCIRDDAKRAFSDLGLVASKRA